MLAAGDGKRLRSSVPKVLHKVSGRALLSHVLATLDEVSVGSTVVVVSQRVNEAREGFGSISEDVAFVIQDRPAGTADATRIGTEALDVSIDRVLVLAGDTPLISATTLARLIQEQARVGAAAALLTAEIPDPSGYGRIVRDADGSVAAIVEDRDVDEAQRAIGEVNASVYVFDRERLEAFLPKIGVQNAQSEYYLTDVVGLMVAEGDQVVAITADAGEVHGVNSRSDLAAVEASMRRRVAERWMAEGVTIVDPETTYIDASVEIAADATIQPFTFLEGETRIGAGAAIGPNARIVDSNIGEGAEVSYAVVRGSTIGPEASVGPFASVRPGTKLGRGSRIGSFVETKAAVIGDNTKANHLAYLGDAEIGSGVNIGAGTITCNWDGKAKHKTVIEDDAYIGSDTMLVAPVRIGARAATGAGAVVREDVPDDALAVGAPARIVEGKGNKMEAEPGE